MQPRPRHARGSAPGAPTRQTQATATSRRAAAHPPPRTFRAPRRVRRRLRMPDAPAPVARDTPAAHTRVRGTWPSLGARAPRRGTDAGESPMRPRPPRPAPPSGIQHHSAVRTRRHCTRCLACRPICWYLPSPPLAAGAPRRRRVRTPVRGSAAPRRGSARHGTPTVTAGAPHAAYFRGAAPRRGSGSAAAATPWRAGFALLKTALRRRRPDALRPPGRAPLRATGPQCSPPQSTTARVTAALATRPRPRRPGAPPPSWRHCAASRTR